jgi:hypothetical protein
MVVAEKKECESVIPILALGLKRMHQMDPKERESERGERKIKQSGPFVFDPMVEIEIIESCYPVRRRKRRNFEVGGRPVTQPPRLRF